MVLCWAHLAVKASTDLLREELFLLPVLLMAELPNVPLQNEKSWCRGFMTSFLFMEIFFMLTEKSTYNHKRLIIYFDIWCAFTSKHMVVNA